MSERIGNFSEEHLLQTAADIVKRKTAHSQVLDDDAERRIPTFLESELVVGKVLGRGGFCVVNEISGIKTAEESSTARIVDDERRIQNVVQDRGFMEANYIREGKDYRYAIKRVQQSSRKDASHFVNAVVDLAVEVRFLAVVRHPSIIKMRAVSKESPFSGKFFIVLDKLFDTLSARIQKWKRARVTGVKKMMDRGGKKQAAFWVERCTVAHDLARALVHLHAMNILYRDLKPENIGFDVRGDVKIFDFGLARELEPALRQSDGTYKLTIDTGSPRYMAPEVALGKTYNDTADVYSFCILLWEILSMTLPFEGFTMKMLQKHVYEKGARPKCEPKWPDSLKDMMALAWGVSTQRRPSMEKVKNLIRDEIAKNTGQKFNESMDFSHKSELSVRRALKQQ